MRSETYLFWTFSLSLGGTRELKRTELYELSPAEGRVRQQTSRGHIPGLSTRVKLSLSYEQGRDLTILTKLRGVRKCVVSHPRSHFVFRGFRASDLPFGRTRP
jgi:hypothetical protein